MNDTIDTNTMIIDNSANLINTIKRQSQATEEYKPQPNIGLIDALYSHPQEL
jgi:hypothetical protein